MGGRGAKSSLKTKRFKLGPNDKKVRVNSKYGEWGYNKEVDMEDSSNYMYNVFGIDNKGKEWFYQTPFYNEILDFIKSDDKTKNRLKNY